MHTRLPGLLALVGLLSAACVPITPEPSVGYRFDSPDRRHIADVAPLGVVTFPTGTSFAATEVGGLSAVAYDPAANLYYLLSDDRSQLNPARLYTARIDLGDGSLQEGDVVFQEVISLTDADGAPYAEGGIDPEGLALAADGRLFLTSEGDVSAAPLLPPFVGAFDRNGRHTGSLSLPAYYLPTVDGTTGIRPNQVFEGVTVTPDQRALVTAVENALLQDGPAADIEQASLSRMLVYDLASGQPSHEWTYSVDAVPATPDPASGYRDNGLADLLALDNGGTFLALERSYAEGVGNTIRLFEADAQGALDVLGEPSLSADGEFPAIGPIVGKRLVIDLAGLGIKPDNVEGMTFGPVLPDGRQSLLLVSDNNFNDTQITQIIALALTLEVLPAPHSP